jgi:hypothetical protein
MLLGLAKCCFVDFRYDLTDYLSTRANMQLSNEPGQSQFMLDIDLKVSWGGRAGWAEGAVGEQVGKQDEELLLPRKEQQ